MRMVFVVLIVVCTRKNEKNECFRKMRGNELNKLIQV